MKLSPKFSATRSASRTAEDYQFIIFLSSSECVYGMISFRFFLLRITRLYVVQKTYVVERISDDVSKTEKKVHRQRILMRFACTHAQRINANSIAANGRAYFRHGISDNRLARVFTRTQPHDRLALNHPYHRRGGLRTTSHQYINACHHWHASDTEIVIASFRITNTI